MALMAGRALLDRPWIAVAGPHPARGVTYCTWRKAIHRVHSGELAWTGRGTACLTWTPEQMTAHMQSVPRDAACARCGRPLGADFTRDHIVPRAYGGRLDAANFRPLCAGCNHGQRHRGGPPPVHGWWVHAGVLSALASYWPDWTDNATLRAAAQRLWDHCGLERHSRRYGHWTAALGGGVSARFQTLPSRIERVVFTCKGHAAGPGDPWVWAALGGLPVAGATPHGRIVVPT